MNILDEIAPKEPQLVMNLAREAGINVEDWETSRADKAKQRRTQSTAMSGHS